MERNAIGRPCLVTQFKELRRRFTQPTLSIEISKPLFIEQSKAVNMYAQPAGHWAARNQINFSQN